MLGKIRSNKFLLAAVLILSVLLAAGALSGKFGKIFSAEENLGELYRVGFITDIHGFRTKKAGGDIIPESKNPLTHFVKHMNENFKPDFAVECGDFIQGNFREGQKSIDDINSLLKYYDELEMPAYHVMGNHESKGLSKQQWSEILGYEATYFSFEKNRFLGIVLDGNEEKEPRYENLPRKPAYYFISDKQFSWLEETLKAAREKNTLPLVFIHFPVPEKLYDKGGEKKIYPEHSAKIMELFEKYGVLAVFSGHLEGVYYEKINGVEYFVLPGVYKTMDDDSGQKWIGSFSEIYVFEDRVRVKLYYKKDFESDYESLWIPQEGEKYSIE